MIFPLLIFRPEDALPVDFKIVIVHGGVAFRSEGQWVSAMPECDGQPIEWEVKWWAHFPNNPLGFL